MSGTKNHRGWGWIRKRASGRYQASYVGPDNLRHFAPTTFALKIDAEEWLTAERREIQNAKAGLRSAIASTGGGAGADLQWMSPKQRVAAAEETFKSQKTLDEYAKEWIAQRDLKPRSRHQYTNLLEKHISPVLGSIFVGNLKPALIRDWYAKTLTDKPTYRSHAYGLLHSVCDTAVRDELLVSNPCNIERATVVKRKREAVVPDVKQLETVAAKIEAKFRALVLISAWCGLRFGEVTELRRKDIRLFPIQSALIRS